MGQGAQLAALFGGPTAVAADMPVNSAAKMAEKLVHRPRESDIINTIQLWEQQINEAAGIQSYDVQRTRIAD